jgi:internalin A
MAILDLSNNPLPDLLSLPIFANLFHLDLNGNTLTDFNPLYKQPALTELSLTNCHLTQLDTLMALDLNVLNLANNRLGRLDGLEVLWNLEVLDVNDNQIRDLTPLLGLKKLQILKLSGNRLTQRASCEQLPIIRQNNPGIEIEIDPNPYGCP